MGATETKEQRESYPRKTELLDLVAFWAGDADRPEVSVSVQMNLVGVGRIKDNKNLLAATRTSSKTTVNIGKLRTRATAGREQAVLGQLSL